MPIGSEVVGSIPTKKSLIIRPMKTKTKIVTKDWLTEKIKQNPTFWIGHALVAIFKNQEQEERAANTTRLKNGIGFSANDARIGSLSAKYFLKHGTLLDWQLKPWLKQNIDCQPRICKYAKQLNEIAVNKLKANGK